MQHTHRTSALRSRPPSLDSEIENERRLTILEWVAADHSEKHDAHHETHAKHDDRLSTIEKSILFLYGLMYLVLQKELPAVAQLLKGMLP